jgi:hypothetical protein
LLSRFPVDGNVSLLATNGLLTTTVSVAVVQFDGFTNPCVYRTHRWYT